MADTLITDITTLPYDEAYASPLNIDAQLGQPTKYYYLDLNADFQENSQLGLLLEDSDAVNKQIGNVLQTLIGTEYFEPLYGSQVPKLLFDATTTTNAFRIQTFIYTGLSTWMSNRITVNTRQSYVIVNSSYPGYDIGIYYSISYSGIQNVFRGKLRV